MATTRLDLSAARALLAEVSATLDELHGQEVEVDYDRGRSRQRGPSPERNQQAEISRDLMRSSELLSAAAGEISVQYWNFKGYKDPRQDDLR